MAKNRGWNGPYPMLLVTMVLWGSAFSSSKSVVEDVPHSVAALLRFGGAALALLAAMAFFGKRRGGSGTGTGRGDSGTGTGAGTEVGSGRTPSAKASRGAGVRAALAGVLGVFAYNSALFWGLSLAPSLDAGILIPVMSPVLTSLFVLVTGRERASWGRLAGLGLGLAGAVIFFLGAGGSAEGSGSRLAGDALFLLSAVCWAAYTLVGARVLTGVEPLRATTYATCAGAVLLAVVAAPELPRVGWGELPSGVWLNAVYLAVGAAAVANLLYYRGVRAVGPASASLMMFCVPVVNTVCGTLFLDESFGAVQAVGALVLLSGAVLTAVQGRLARRNGAAGGRASSAGPEQVSGSERVSEDDVSGEERGPGAERVPGEDVDASGGEDGGGRAPTPSTERGV